MEPISIAVPNIHSAIPIIFDARCTMDGKRANIYYKIVESDQSCTCNTTHHEISEKRTVSRSAIHSAAELYEATFDASRKFDFGNRYERFAETPNAG